MPILQTARNNEDRNKMKQYRTDCWRDICKQQFELDYYANISIDSTDSMAPYERKLYYQYLTDQKQSEQEAQKERLRQLNKG